MTTKHKGNPKWVKGVSQNPGGRPKEWAEVREMCRKLEPFTIKILINLAENAKSEMVRFLAVQRLRDEAWGRPTQRTELVGAEGGPVQLAARSWVDLMVESTRQQAIASSTQPLVIDAPSDDE